MDRIVLAVDAMGGDNAPDCVIDAVKRFLTGHDDTDVCLFGPEELLKQKTEDFGSLKSRIAVKDAPEVITMEDEPLMAVRRKKNSSMLLGLTEVKNGDAGAFVSAGSTGALFMGAMVILRMLKGIDRPALAPVIPGLNNKFILLDSGANADCQSEYLRQFGLMGSVYMQCVEGVQNPKVALVNIGAEEEKGSRLYKEAHALMKAQTVYNFTGNIEARDIQYGDTDVVVADGFTGNVILKYAEGFARCMFKMIKKEVTATARGKLGGLLLKPALGGVKKRMDMDEYGGAPLLGVNGAVVKAHGSSGAYAFMKAMEQARRMVKGGMVTALARGLEQINQTEEQI